MILVTWYDREGTPDRGTWWCAVEHLGHPAFYLRSLLPGDFAPGRGPAPRHAVDLDGEEPPQTLPVRCGTCGKVPRTEDLEPVERATGDHGFLDSFRRGDRPWPRPTGAASCWMCSDPRRPALVEVETPGGEPARACEGCAHLLKRR